MSGNNPPLAGIDAAGNVRLNSAAKIQAHRFIPSVSRVLSSYYMKVKSTASDGSSYAGGNGGNMLLQVCGETVSHEPDLTNVILTVDVGALATLNPATTQNGVKADLNLFVTAGIPYWFVISNNDDEPATNYFSVNYGYVKDGMAGANAANSQQSEMELRYGLDPLEVVAGSGDGGDTWNIPGDAVSGAVLTKHMPTYIAKYEDGMVQAQPYYSATAPANGDKTCVYQNFPHEWQIQEIVVWTNGNTSTSGTSDVAVLVNDVLHETVTVTGAGFLRTPLTVPRWIGRDDVLKLSFAVDNTGAAGLALLEQYADTYFATLMSLGDTSRWYHTGSVLRIIPVMPAPHPYPVGPYGYRRGTSGGRGRR